MAPIADNLTKRYYLDYTAGNVKHTLIMRTRDMIADNVAISKFQAFLNAMAPALNKLSVLGVRKSEIGSNVSFPIGYTGTAVFGTGDQQPENTPKFVSFVGRDVDGVRVRVFLYGVTYSPDGNYRYSPGESASADAALGVIRATAGLFTTAQGKDAVWNSYANFGFSAYWQRRRRRV